MKALLPASDPAVVAKARNKKKAHKAAELQKEGKKHQVSDAFMVGRDTTWWREYGFGRKQEIIECENLGSGCRLMMEL